MIEEKSNSFIDYNGFVWEDIGKGILITNFDGSPISNLESLNGEEENKPAEKR